MKNRITLAGILAIIFAVFLATTAVSAQPPVPPGEEGLYYIVPADSSAPYSNSRTIEVGVNSSIPIRGGMVTIETSDKECGKITSCSYNSTEWTAYGTNVVEEGGKRAIITFGDTAENPSGVYPIGEMTVQCNSTTDCIANLNFVYETYISNNAGDYDVNDPYPNKAGTFGCGYVITTFSKDLAVDWNLISLPLIPLDNSTSTVLGGTIAYDAVYSYDAINNDFVDVSGGAMDPGTGYFVHVTTAGTWTYNGKQPYTEIDISLEPGLNMVGWLNCSKPISDGLSSIADNYYYVARWNATSQSFETYNPVAPNGFNDFDTMDRGEGYFISAKEGCPSLTESC